MNIRHFRNLFRLLYEVESLMVVLIQPHCLRITYQDRNCTVLFMQGEPSPLILLLKQSKMLESNHLYRRIEHNNLFRTFSRAYSRQGQQINRGKSRPEGHGRSTGITIESSSTLGSRFGYCKTVGLEPQTERIEQGGSMPIIIPQKQSVVEIRQPFTIAALPQTGESVSWMDEGLSGRRLSTNTLLPTWNVRKRLDNFKLKSCMEKKTVNYETKQDEAEFSLLQAARRKILIQQQQRGLKTSLGGIGKKGMAGILPKYSRLVEQRGFDPHKREEQ